MRNGTFPGNGRVTRPPSPAGGLLFASLCRAAVASLQGAARMAAAGKVVSPPYPHAGLVGEGSVSRVSFLGARLPPEVEAMAKSVRELSKETFRKLLKGAPPPPDVCVCVSVQALQQQSAFFNPCE